MTVRGRKSNMSDVRLSGAGIAVAALCGTGIAAFLWAYPLPAWPLALCLGVYAAALWRWPSIFLAAIAASLPSIDLGLWTGWLGLGEPDAVILTSIAVLVLRDPPGAEDIWPKTAAHWVFLSLCAVFAAGAVLGLLTQPVPGGASANPYLRPDNALRLLKPFAEALALFPFIRHGQRTDREFPRLLGWGMLTGLSLVAAETIAERAMFPGLLSFRSDYRVTAAFVSMHMGGGHIGAYAAMMLPFLVASGLMVRKSMTWLVLGPIALAGAYTIAVTFARTAYAAGLMSAAIALGVWAVFQPRRGARAVWLAIPVAAVVLLSGSYGYMRDRFAAGPEDLLIREANWRGGWAIRDRGPIAAVLGTGLGTYPRLALARGTGDRPTNFWVEDGTLSIAAGTSLFIGQHIAFPPSHALHLKLAWRANEAAAGLTAIVCEKVMLYSDNCREAVLTPAAVSTWTDVDTVLPAEGLGSGGRLVEFALFSRVRGTTVSVRDVSLTDDQGWEVLSNRDFRDGMNRWLFTDDLHTAWRMKNLYLMLLFQTGAAGLAAFLATALLAAGGGVRAVRQGNPMGAAIVGAVAAFLISGLFDDVLEAPRLAMLFLLICLSGMTMQGAEAVPTAIGEIEDF